MTITLETPTNASRHVTPRPVSVLMDSVTGMQLLYVTVRLELADILSNGPLSALEASNRIAANPHCLLRIMRELVDRGVLHENRDGRFALAAAGNCLRRDDPESMCDVIIARGDRSRLAGAGLLEVVRYGGVPFHRMYSTNFFSWVASHAVRSLSA